MNVLGLIGFGENPAACLVRDGRLVAFGEEERFTRLKGSHGLFPSRAAAWCLRSQGLELGDLDRIAFPWDTRQYPWRVGLRFARIFLRHRRRATQTGGSPFATAGEVLLLWEPARVRKGIRDGLRHAGLAGELPPIEFVPHHLAHAYSTYPMSGFERAGILTIDGSGEQTATQLAIGEGESIRVLESIPIPHSLGWFYAAITQYLGFLPLRDEGKVMGLAALGEERSADNRWLEPLSRVLRVDDGSYEVDPVYTHFGGHEYGDRFTDGLASFLTSVDPEARPIAYGERVETDGAPRSRYLLDTYVDLAWAAQELLERAAVGLARRLVREQGVDALCLAGGVTLNCKMNGEILRRSGARRLFVQPAANDGGAALGAALYVSSELGAPIYHPLHHTQFGPSFAADEIRAALDAARVPYRELDDVSLEAARWLDDGRIIAWFQGAMEFGARALGGRSILANPARPEMRERVNAEVKLREAWRPFCPSLREGAESTYLKEPGDAAYMIVAYEASETCRSALPAVVHVDGTVRPQRVRSDTTPRFHRLLDELGHRSGHPVALNTSFNVRGEPLVCTPHDALRCFYSTGLEALFLGDFLVTKEHQRPYASDTGASR